MTSAGRKAIRWWGALKVRPNADGDRTSSSLSVLSSVADSHSENPFIDQFFQAIEPVVFSMKFDWPTALLTRYDVFHVQWPETLTRPADSHETLKYYAYCFALLLRLKISRTVVVRTFHNLEPHEGNRNWIEGLILHLFDRATDLVVTLTPSSPAQALRCPAVHIPHGHYKAYYRRDRLSPGVPRSLLFFGLIRAYKGVDDLLEAFLQTGEECTRLIIAGRCTDPKLGAELEARAKLDSRIDLRLEFIDDDSLIDLILDSSGVVLPYRRMMSSGAVLLALSLNTPVLVPSNPTTQALADEVGADWVHLFEGRITPELLRKFAIHECSDIGGPDLSRRSWDQAGAMYRSAYELAVKNSRG